VRFVAHLDLPKSLEAYHQETGRAGRDGLPADAWMAYGLGDVVQLRSLIDRSESPEERKIIERRKLDALLAYCEVSSCRRQTLLRYFGEALAVPCGNCDTCLEPVETWDATVPVRKALSAIVRSGQRFGALHVIDVLLGNATEKIQRNGHDRLPTFGVGTELTQNEWRSVLSQLVVRGYLRVDLAGHNGLALTVAAAPVLKGTEPVSLRALRKKSRAPKEPRAPRSAAGSSGAKPLDFAAGSENEALFERLRVLRSRLAAASNVPPYVVFHDSTLRAIAELRPANLSQLRAVSGIGEHKLARYGDEVLSLLRGAEAAGPPADQPAS
jgi:ATP-dependent DNA helicase RecQ